MQFQKRSDLPEFPAFVTTKRATTSISNPNYHTMSYGFACPCCGKVNLHEASGLRVSHCKCYDSYLVITLDDLTPEMIEAGRVTCYHSPKNDPGWTLGTYIFVTARYEQIGMFGDNGKPPHFVGNVEREEQVKVFAEMNA